MDLIVEGHNWLIIDFLSEERLERARAVCDDAFDFDYSDYTSAKGPNSTQRYLIKPDWMDVQGFKTSKLWPDVNKEWTEIVQKQLVHHGLMPYSWENFQSNIAWTVTGHEGSFHTAHDHGCRNVSTVTYLDVPERVGEEAYYPDGEIFFVLHSEQFNELAPPKQRVLTVKPQTGMIIMFPSWIVHGVYPQGPGIRRTLNIDFHGYENLSNGGTTPGIGRFG